jgi:hypothetical protein
MTKLTLLLVGFFILNISLQAQSFVNPEIQNQELAEQQEDTYQAINFSLDTKNMHLWRGYKVSNNAMTALNANYTSRNEKLKIGLWNGISFDGSYTEFDYYFSYEISNKVNLSVWDINNFSDFPGANIFNYKRETTSHFVDATLSFKATDKLGLSWSTILAGRDFYRTENGEVRSSFSNFVEARYKAFDINQTSVNLFLGGAFSFVNEAHFYGSSPGIVNFGILLSKEIDVLGSTLPVSAMAMWNPEQNYGAMQLQIGLF